MDEMVSDPPLIDGVVVKGLMAHDSRWLGLSRWRQHSSMISCSFIGCCRYTTGCYDGQVRIDFRKPAFA